MRNSLTDYGEKANTGIAGALLFFDRIARTLKVEKKKCSRYANSPT